MFGLRAGVLRSDGFIWNYGAEFYYRYRLQETINYEGGARGKGVVERGHELVVQASDSGFCTEKRWHGRDNTRMFSTLSWNEWAWNLANIHCCSKMAVPGLRHGSSGRAAKRKGNSGGVLLVTEVLSSVSCSVVGRLGVPNHLGWGEMGKYEIWWEIVAFMIRCWEGKEGNNCKHVKIFDSINELMLWINGLAGRLPGGLLVRVFAYYFYIACSVALLIKLHRLLNCTLLNFTTHSSCDTMGEKGITL